MPTVYFNKTTGSPMFYSIKGELQDLSDELIAVELTEDELTERLSRIIPEGKTWKHRFSFLKLENGQAKLDAEKYDRYMEKIQDVV